MRKILTLTLAAAVSIMLVTGCGGSGEVVDTKTPEETNQAKSGDASKPVVAKPVKKAVKPTDDGEVKPGEKDSKTMSKAAMAKLNELTRIYFEFDKAQITSDAAKTLKQNAAILKTVPGAKVTIEGHCDERGTTEYNLALGERRASAVKQFLVDAGASADTMDTVSKGEEDPAVSGSDEQAWAKNRRAEFKVAK